MAHNADLRISLRTLQEEDLPTTFEIQLDDTARHLAAFTDKTARDRDAYLQKFRKILANDAIVTKAVEIDGEVVGSVAVYPVEGGTELTYWIRKDWWGRGVATAAVGALLKEVTVRPLHARVAEDNHGSIRVLERNGFGLVGRENSFSAERQATITELTFRLSHRFVDQDCSNRRRAQRARSARLPLPRATAGCQLHLLHLKGVTRAPCLALTRAAWPSKARPGIACQAGRSSSCGNSREVCPCRHPRVDPPRWPAKPFRSCRGKERRRPPLRLFATTCVPAMMVSTAG